MLVPILLTCPDLLLASKMASFGSPWSSTSGGSDQAILAFLTQEYSEYHDWVRYIVSLLQLTLPLNMSPLTSAILGELQDSQSTQIRALGPNGPSPCLSEWQNGSSQSLARIMFAVIVIGVIGFLLDQLMSAAEKLVSRNRRA